MEILNEKLPHLTATATAESFFQVPSIEDTARQILMKGKSAAHRISSKLMSQFVPLQKIDPILICDHPPSCDQPPPGKTSYAKNTTLEQGIYTLANNPETSAALLNYLSIGSSVNISESVLESIARNESAPTITLEHLANHPSPAVRAAVTENQHAPFEILYGLCEDTHPDVRFTMAENPYLPRILLTILAADDNPYVASRACTTLDRLGAI